MTIKAVSENRNLFFDEMIQYEIKGGDIYKEEPGEEETCNCSERTRGAGRFPDADISGISVNIRYLILPQVKTTIYRALPDGGRQEEIYSTDSILETESFQVTDNWLYYLADEGSVQKRAGIPMRRNILPEMWNIILHGTTRLYYMKDRTLESVSKGLNIPEQRPDIRSRCRSRVCASGRIGQSGVGRRERRGSGRGQDLPSGGRRDQISQSGAAKEQGRDILHRRCRNGPENILEGRSRNKGGLVRQEGLVADSFCIAGEWLYYSARTQYGAECVRSRFTV